MAKRVLVPLDRTERAEQALKALPGLFDKGDEVILLSVAEEPHRTQQGTRPGRVVLSVGGVPAAASRDFPRYAETYDQALARQLDDMESYLRPKARELEEQGFHVSMAFEISDEPAKAIADVARHTKPTFIVMVRTTHPGIGGRLFGTVAQQVIREDVAPVVILPAND